MIWKDFAYLLAAVLFILGIKRLSTVRSARQGNFLAALAMFIAVFTTLCDHLEFELIIAGIILGSSIGAIMAMRIQMTGMPQMVALFNGFGGISSLLVASSEFLRSFSVEIGSSAAVGSSIFIGGITFTGSLIAFGKLQGIVSEKSVIFRGQHMLNAILILLCAFLGTLLCFSYEELANFFSLLNLTEPLPANTILFVLIGLSLLVGVLVVIPIGGADMPVVISLLNSYSGIAAAMTGFVLSNKVLIITGALVGASGIILTRIMCVSMNRSLLNVLLGGFGNVAGSSSGMAEADGKEIIVKQVGTEEAAMLFDTAASVIIVPGYGMAVAQAQHVVRELSDVLAKKDISVKYAIHPVAGRMPGHMNVLLAEANVPYESLYEMERINDEFANTDIALVVGANDVTNPAARYSKSSPIYGMPILNVDKARTAVVIKRSLKPGYAGIDNELYGYPNCLMYLGDAKDAIAKLITEIKSNA